MIQRAIKCDGRCGAVIIWNVDHGEKSPTKSLMEQTARNKGWHAPDRLGAHFCLNCRSRAGAEQWWRKENVRRGLDAGYGLGRCTCDGQSDTCSSAGHPGVVSRV